MQRTNFKKERIPFTQVANEVLNDKNLSAKAKGLYAYLYSKPDGWDFAIDRIALDFSDGRKAINSGLQELEREGYLYRERQKTGRVVYILKTQMTKTDIGGKKPHAQNGKEPKRQRAKTGTVSNTDTIAIKSNSNKDTTALANIDLVGEYENVRLTEKDRVDLTAQIGAEALADLIEQLSRYIVQQGKDPYKGETHRATIQTWARRRKDELAAKHKSFTMIG